jgi:hypothetical protein
LYVDERDNVVMLPKENRIYDTLYAKCDLDTLFVDKIFYISFIIIFATPANNQYIFFTICVDEED